MTLERTMVERLLPAYEIEGELGRGAWGIVYSARHRHLGRQVAVKQLPRAFGADPEAKRRFVSEARMLASLDHPHIVPVYDYAEDGGLCLLVMERLSGGTLWAKWSSQGLDQRSAVAAVLAVLAGLEHAHRAGVLHRDIKPENILYSGSGRPKLADFGIAKVLGGADAQATRVGDVLGTPAYIAPEQAQGAPLGPTTDVYATAVVLYELLAGRLPFSEEGDAMALLWRHVYETPTPLAEVAPAVPIAVGEMVMAALSKSPADRPASAEQFAVGLAAAASGAWGPGWLDATGVPIDLATAVQQALRDMRPSSPATGTAGRTLPPPSSTHSAVTVIAATVAGLPPLVPAAPTASIAVVTMRGAALATQAAALAREAGRPHLATVLDRVAGRVQSPTPTVLLGGGHRSGKSTLVRALADTPGRYLELGGDNGPLQRGVLRGLARGVDGAILAIPAGRAMDAADRDSLTVLARSRVPTVVCVTKSDLHPSALTQSLLLDILRDLPGVRLHLIAAELALEAPDDEAMRRESGLIPLRASLDREFLQPHVALVTEEAAKLTAAVLLQLLTGHSAGSVDLGVPDGSTMRTRAAAALDAALAASATELDNEVNRLAALLAHADGEPAWRTTTEIVVRDLAAAVGTLVACAADALDTVVGETWDDWLHLEHDHPGGAGSGEQVHGGTTALLTRATLPVVLEQLGVIATTLTAAWVLPGPGITGTAAARDERLAHGRERCTAAVEVLPTLGHQMAAQLVVTVRDAATEAIDSFAAEADLLAADLACATAGRELDPALASSVRALLDATAMGATA